MSVRQAGQRRSSKLGRFWDQVEEARGHPATQGNRARAALVVAKYHAMARIGSAPVHQLGERSRIRADKRFPSSVRVLSGNPPPGDAPYLLAWRKLLGPGALFVDIGANAGLYSIWAADLGASVVAAEPNPQARRALARNAALNGYRFEIVDAALSDTPGWVRFTVELGQEGHLLCADDPGGVEVETTTLDLVLGDRCADGIKVDVEGAERLVLEGASRAIREHRIRAMQLEYNFQSRKYYGETRELLRDRLIDDGYVLCRPDEEGRLRPTALGPGGGADIFAVLPDLLAR